MSAAVLQMVNTLSLYEARKLELLADRAIAKGLPVAYAGGKLTWLEHRERKLRFAYDRAVKGEKFGKFVAEMQEGNTLRAIHISTLDEIQTWTLELCYHIGIVELQRSPFGLTLWRWYSEGKHGSKDENAWRPAPEGFKW